MSIKTYINLTNGIEAIKQYRLTDYSFIRIQSTACEQKHWDSLILDLDYDFLMNVALGNKCLVFDYGTKKPKARALWQGMAFVEYVLRRYWYNEGKPLDAIIQRTHNPTTRHNVSKYFDEEYRALPNSVFKKLHYFKPFLGGIIDIHCVNGSTEYDGNKEYYAEILKDCPTRTNEAAEMNAIQKEIGLCSFI